MTRIQVGNSSYDLFFIFDTLGWMFPSLSDWKSLSLLSKEWNRKVTILREIRELIDSNLLYRGGWVTSYQRQLSIHIWANYVKPKWFKCSWVPSLRSFFDKDSRDRCYEVGLVISYFPVDLTPIPQELKDAIIAKKFLFNDDSGILDWAEQAISKKYGKEWVYFVLEQWYNPYSHFMDLDILEMAYQIFPEMDEIAARKMRDLVSPNFKDKWVSEIKDLSPGEYTETISDLCEMTTRCSLPKYKEEALKLVDMLMDDIDLSRSFLQMYSRKKQNTPK